MTVVQTQRKWTIDEFFAWNEHQEEKCELVGGVPTPKRVPVAVMLPGQTAPTMMTGASRRHNKVNSNLARLFGNQLHGGPCSACVNDAAVKTAEDQIRFPDLVIDCGTRMDGGYIFDHPKLLAEILSPATRTFDLAGKLTECWRIETIRSVMVIDPDHLRLQLHTRCPGEAPALGIFSDPEDAVAFPEIGVTLRLGDIFEGLAPVSEQ